MAERQKKLHQARGRLVFLDESALSLTPPLRTTWARRGCTPIVRHRLSWRQYSMAAALGYRHNGCPCGLSFQVIAGGYNHQRVLGFLHRLLHRYRRGPLWLVWDRLPAHRDARVQRFLHRHRRLHLIWLPPYAPECNPVDWLWPNLKGRELANHDPDTDAALRRYAHRGIRRIRASRRLPTSFLRAARLTL